MLIERILSRVERDENECLIWQGPLNNSGYAYTGGKLVHRFVYEHFVGPIPTDMEIDHVFERGCRSRACLNWRHMEAITHEENMRRLQLAKTHCKNNHEFTPENTYIRKGTRQRMCRTCLRDSTNRSRRKTNQ